MADHQVNIESSGNVTPSPVEVDYEVSGLEFATPQDVDAMLRPQNHGPSDGFMYLMITGADQSRSQVQSRIQRSEIH
jgi:hypothetical protein